jgi:hypothetical protein
MTAVGKAVSSALESPDAGQLWSGPISASEHDGSYGDHSVAYGETNETLGSPQPANPVAGDDPADAEISSGGIATSDTGWPSTEAASAPWDSNAGQPFAGSSGVSDVHAQDVGTKPAWTGPEYGVAHDVNQANQSYAPAYEWDSGTGRREAEATAHVAHDEFHGAGSDIDYRPRFWDVVLRPIRNNVAATAQPLNPVPSADGVQGTTPDIVRNASDQSVLYDSPPDPNVSEPKSGQSWDYSIPGVL